jgi:hypothetical protein
MIRRLLPPALLILAACATTAPLALPAVGPSGPAESSSEAPEMGTLIVYSDTLTTAKHRSPPVYPHSGYVVRKPRGKVVARVDNNASEVDAMPETVPLAPGLYEVQARAAKVGTVLVPVMISPGQQTEVYLDAQGMPAAQARTLTDPVTLSDGRVVGARVVADSPRPP